MSGAVMFLWVLVCLVLAYLFSRKFKRTHVLLWFLLSLIFGFVVQQWTLRAPERGREVASEYGGGHPVSAVASSRTGLGLSSDPCPFGNDPRPPSLEEYRVPWNSNLEFKIHLCGEEESAPGEVGYARSNWYLTSSRPRSENVEYSSLSIQNEDSGSEMILTLHVTCEPVSILGVEMDYSNVDVEDPLGEVPEKAFAKALEIHCNPDIRRKEMEFVASNVLSDGLITFGVDDLTAALRCRWRGERPGDHYDFFFSKAAANASAREGVAVIVNLNYFDYAVLDGFAADVEEYTFLRVFSYRKGESLGKLQFARLNRQNLELRLEYPKTSGLYRNWDDYACRHLGDEEARKAFEDIQIRKQQHISEIERKAAEREAAAERERLEKIRAQQF